MHRISVVMKDKLVPLIPGRPLADSRFSPWKGLAVEKHCVGAIEIPEHEHASYCLHMQTSGPVEMEWHSHGKTGRQSTQTGALILVTPGSSHGLRWSGASLRVLVSIDPTLLERALLELDGRGAIPLDSRWGFRDLQLELLLTEIAREMEAGWTMGALYGDLLGMSLSLALVRKYGNAQAHGAMARGGIAGARLKRILEYMEERCQTSLRLADLAEVAGLSEFHFARSFRQSTGLPPHQYQLQLRMQKAKSLLRAPQQNVAEVAALMGFPSVSHFSRTFKRLVGVNPSDWRRGA
jgi:AraC family transcriptional regulator